MRTESISTVPIEDLVESGKSFKRKGPAVPWCNCSPEVKTKMELWTRRKPNQDGLCPDCLHYLYYSHKQP